VAALFGRRAWIQVGDRRFDGLHLHFKVTKTLTGDANPAEISVFNLAAASRAALPTKDVPVVLVAGYVGATEVIFAGDIRTVDHVRQGPDWVTHLRAGDGEACFERSYSVASFGPNTPITAVFEAFAKDLGVSVKDALQRLRSGDVKAAFSTFLQGYSAQGRTVRELDRVTKAAALEWSIQDGVLQLLEPGKVTADVAVKLSAKTGLIGSPDHGKPQKPNAPSYLHAKSLLNGGLRPGRAVVLEAADRSGDYRVERVTHVGELDGQAWYSQVDLVPWGSEPPDDAKDFDPEEFMP
jgi:hypothetical protein